MFTVLVKNDNTVIVTERQRIMQNSKLVDALQIIVPKTYNDLEMASYNTRLEYLTPINHNLGYIELELADDDYMTDYLLYKLKIDSNLTSEVGDVQFAITFVDVTMDTDGEVETQVRKTDTFIMPVIPIANWFVVPDKALNELDQRIAATQEVVKAMADLQASKLDSKIDDIKLDTDTNMLYGTSGGVKQGEGIALNDLGDAIADNTTDGMVYINTYDDAEEGSS